MRATGTEFLFFVRAATITSSEPDHDGAFQRIPTDGGLGKGMDVLKLSTYCTERPGAAVLPTF
jgi:hypothetical protein